MIRWVVGLFMVGLASVAAYAQFQVPGVGGSGVAAPGGSGQGLQYNNSGNFGGISGVTSDAANVGFATSSQLILYGLSVGDCLKIGANNQIADSGGACGGSGSPGGSNSQVQFNTNGTFGGISGATSNGSNISFTTNSLVINGQAISKVSGTTGTLATVTGSLSTNCIKADGSGNLVDAATPCGGTSATNIAAGSNITTSGTTSNVTVNVVATPTFTSITTTLASVTGWLTAAGVNAQTETLAGALNGSTANFTGNLTAPTAQITGFLTAAGANLQTATLAGVLNGSTAVFTGNLTAGSAQFAGFLTAGGASLSGLNLATGTMSGNLTGTTHNLSGNLTAGTAQFTGAVTGTTALFQTITDAGFSAATQCVQATNGVLAGTGVGCATSGTTVSIAAGSNITTSGTASNITVNMVPATPEFGLQYNHGGVLTADSGFTYFSGIATHTLGSVTTTNARALSIIGTLSSSTVQFDAPWFMNITTSGFAVGSKLADIQASGLSVFSVSPSGSLSSAALSSAASQCLQASLSGTILGFGVPCATQTSTPSIAAGTNITTSGTAANTTVNLVATPSVTTLIASGNLTAGSAQFSGFLTAGGASLSGLTIATETLSSNLTGTTANFSSNLTANIAQFPGFLSAGGGSLSGLNIATETLSGALNGSTANFTGNLTGTTAQFSGQVTGTTAVFQTVTAQNFTTLAQGFVGTPAAGSGTAFLRGDNTFSTPTTLGLAASTTTTPLGWINVNGQGRLTADSVGFITTGVVNLIILNGLVAGRTYYFNAELPLKSATASTGGIALRVGGGATATSIVYDGWIVDSGFNGIKGNTQATALSTSVANSSITGTTSHARLVGTITVNAAGSIVLQASGFSTVTAASAVTVGRGATFTAQDIP